MLERLCSEWLFFLLAMVLWNWTKNMESGNLGAFVPAPHEAVVASIEQRAGFCCISTTQLLHAPF